MRSSRYYFRRDIAVRVVYCLTMCARATAIRVICVLTAIGFAAGAAPVTPHLPPRSDRSVEMADLHYDIAHGTTSASPPSSFDMAEAFTCGYRDAFDLDAACTLTDFLPATRRAFIMLCSICVPLCFMMYRYRCKVGLFAEMRWALPSGNTAVRSVRWTLPFEPRPMPRCHPPPVSQPDRQPPSEPASTPTFVGGAQPYVHVPADEHPVFLGNAQMLRECQQKFIRQSADLRAAGAEILSLGDSYDRSVSQVSRLTDELNVARARLTGYTHELDVAHARLTDMARRLHEADEVDAAAPVIAVAQPVLPAAPAEVDVTLLTESAWIQYIAEIIAARYSLLIATATTIFSNMLPTFLDSIRHHDVYHSINGSGIDLPLWDKQYAPNQFVNLDFEGYEKIHNIFAKHCGLTWALGPIWVINRRLHNTFRQVVLLKFPQVPTPHHILDSRGNLLPIEDRKRNDLLLGVNGIIIQAKLAGDRRIAARELRRQQLREFESARALATVVPDVDVSAEPDFADPDLEDYANQQARAHVHGPRARARVRGPRTASGVLLAIICLFMCIAPAHATNDVTSAAATAAAVATAAVAAATVAVTLSVAAVYSTTAQAAAAQQQVHDVLEANRLRGAGRAAGEFRRRAPRGWRVPSPFRPLNQAAIAKNTSVLAAATAAHGAALAATAALAVAIAAVDCVRDHAPAPAMTDAQRDEETRVLRGAQGAPCRRRRADGSYSTRRGARRRVARIPFNATALMFLLTCISPVHATNGSALAAAAAAHGAALAAAAALAVAIEAVVSAYLHDADDSIQRTENARYMEETAQAERGQQHEHTPMTPDERTEFFSNIKLKYVRSSDPGCGPSDHQPPPPYSYVAGTYNHADAVTKPRSSTRLATLSALAIIAPTDGAPSALDGSNTITLVRYMASDPYSTLCVVVVLALLAITMYCVTTTHRHTTTAANTPRFRLPTCGATQTEIATVLFMMAVGYACSAGSRVHGSELPTAPPVRVFNTQPMIDQPAWAVVLLALTTMGCGYMYSIVTHTHHSTVSLRVTNAAGSIALNAFKYLDDRTKQALLPPHPATTGSASGCPSGSATSGDCATKRMVSSYPAAQQASVQLVPIAHWQAQAS
jgi:hypothetical protein